MKLILMPLLLLIASPLVGRCQKLPNIQVTQIQLPADIKIDGKSSEWNGNYQAYNKTVELFYTLANDSSNLYLIVHANKKRVIQKIISVGLTFSIKNISDNPKAELQITYPLIDAKNGMLIISYSGSKGNLPGTIPNRRPDTMKTPDQKEADSLRLIANDLLVKNANTIKIKGLPVLSDTLISIYNEERIRTACQFERSGEYTYEISIPIKYLGKSATAKNIDYNIRLNSRWVEPKNGMPIRYYYPVKGGGPVPADPDLDSTTDFSGKYSFH